jgi:hypothetical protein
MFDIELLDALPEETKAKINEWHQKVTVAITRAKTDQFNELSTMKERVASYGGFDAIDTIKKKADTADAAEAAASEAELKEATAKGDLTSVTKQFQEQLAARDKEIENIRNGLANKEKQAIINSAISAEQGTPELLLPHIEPRIKSKMENGMTVLTVLKVDGTPWITENGPATVADLVNEFKGNDVFGSCFRASKGSGSGSTTNTGHSAPNELKTITDVMAAVKAGTLSEEMGRARAKELSSSQAKTVSSIH